MYQTSSSFKKYHSQNPLKIFFVRRFLDNIVKEVAKLKVDNILDAACGEALVMKKIKETGIQAKIEGFDISENSLNYARKLLPKHRFFLGNILDIDCLNASYDLVLALEVLEHLSKPEQALKELSRVSKNYVLISVPWEPWFSLGNLLSGKNLKRLGQDKDHRQFWGKSGINKLVDKYMDIVFSKTSFPWIIILAKKKK